LGVYRDEANRRLAKHLETLPGDLFTFLLHPGLEGTNWAAETELRYAVVNRKTTCGSGNRTRAGATAQAVLMTLSRTATRRGHDDVTLFADLVWGLPQVWTFTQRLTPLKVAVCLGTLLVSIAFLWTQAVNPFLYYQS
jgi:hypothetical protein